MSQRGSGADAAPHPKPTLLVRDDGLDPFSPKGSRSDSDQQHPTKWSGRQRQIRRALPPGVPGPACLNHSPVCHSHDIGKLWVADSVIRRA